MSLEELNLYHGDQIEEHYKHILNFLEWWRFREVTRAGINSISILRTDGNPLTNEDLYRFTCCGRTNYTIYLALAGVLEKIREFEELQRSGPDAGRKKLLLHGMLSDVYFRFGSALDAIGRLLSILFDRRVRTIEQYQKMDFGRFCQQHRGTPFPNLTCDTNGAQLREITNVRNHLAHYWISVFYWDSDQNRYLLPPIIRTNSGLIWWHSPPVPGGIEILVNGNRLSGENFFQTDLAGC